MGTSHTTHRLVNDHAACFIAIAAQALKDSDFESAQTAAEAAVLCDGENVTALFTLAVVFSKRDEFQRAAACLQSAVKLAPQSLPLWTALGECHLSALNYAEATVALRRALELDPKSEQPAGRRARAVVAQTLLKQMNR